MRKALISPTKYVQSEGALYDLGCYMSQYGKSALLIAHKDDSARVQKQLDATVEKYGVNFVKVDFNGECSRQEVARLKDIAKDKSCDIIIGLGGGKAIDTAKCVGSAAKPVIICPTIAATDAPTSSSAVLYTPSGEFDDYDYFVNPAAVVVDLSVVACAPTRFLVSGMGDALSTYFEARSCARAYARVNASGYQMPYACGTKAALALATLCYDTLLEDGYKAKLACDANVVTAALENIVETNILLSGVGFESGGLAAAHAIHNGLTVLEETHKYFHGEKVAFGTLVHLVLENADSEEIQEVLDFCLSVGLPICLADLGVQEIGADRLAKVAAQSTIPEESIHNMPFPVTADMVAAAILAADKLGAAAKGECCCG